MFTLFEKIRQKPIAVRKRAAFLMALLVAGVIFVVWLSVIYPDFSHDQDLQAKAQAKVSEPSAFSAFGSTLSEGFSKIGEQFGSLKSIVSSYTTEPAYFTATSTATSTDSITSSPDTLSASSTTTPEQGVKETEN